MSGEEGFRSDIHASPVRRVERVDQAEVFGAPRDNSKSRQRDEFASWLRRIN